VPFDAETVLVNGSMDTEASVRAAATKALGQRGEAQESTRKRLRELTDDAHATVRAAAVEALTKVRPKPKNQDSK
jgi:HEAT repeat protein